jgi:hypothetical protein
MPMNRNQRTALLYLFGTIVVLVVVGLGYLMWKQTQVVHCPDGTSHPKIDAAQFATQYTGITVNLEAKFAKTGEFSADLGTQKLQEMSEALQQSRLHMQALAAGYDACAVNAESFNEARSRYQRMEDIASQLTTISNHKPLSEAEKAQLIQLVDEYIQISRSPK